MTGFYLTLRVFYNHNFKISSINSKYYVKAKADSIRDFLTKYNFNNSDFLFNIDLCSDNILSTIHESGTILAKYYDSQDIPSEKELINDLNFFIDLNEFIFENYNNDIDISNEEWLDALSNTDVINTEMFSIMKILTENDDYTSTFEEISEKMKLLGFDNLNIFTTVVINSLNVKKYLKKRKILDSDNNDLFWMVFFNWDIVKDHKLVLRDDLIEIFKNNFEIIEENRMNYEIEKNGISFYNYLLKENYYFDKELIENFLLSLKIKPFILCVGNSGTGKTKLSQLFAKYLIEKTLKNKNGETYSVGDESKSFLASVKVGKSAINKGWAIPREDSINLIPKMNCEESFPALIDGIPAKGKINFNVRFFYETDDKVKNHLKKLADENPNQRITLKLDVPSELTEKETKMLEDKYYDSNYKIIPVGANWTENRHIVGYYNVITNEYQSTPAYDLIKAANNSTEPHFLILDEMNLSHVERYFADFLSAIESKEKIPLYGEEELTLPQNLFIIGTVNVDETTYMFSPKVLDRANVIEFETYSAIDYMNNGINLLSPSGNISYLEDPLAGNHIRDYGIGELRDLFIEVTAEEQSFWNILTEEIFSFQSILKESGFDFGFRVINEMVRFMAVAWEYEDKPLNFTNWTRYFDACIKQKLLPKLHGSEKIIGETLDELYKKCLSSAVETEDMAKYPESYKKLKEMREVLRKQRYVSFIN